MGQSVLNKERKMGRSGKVQRKKINGDPVYNSVDLQRFINKIMYDGKKGKSEKIVYGALEEVQKKLKKEPIEIFQEVLTSLVPLMVVKSRRVGGATYQVPVEVSADRGKALAMKWLKDSARERAGKSMIQKLSSEMIDVFNKVGGALKKREDMHKTAEANKAFAHFRW